MALYQEIMRVPGLTGTWQERNKQLYYKLGAPYGTYSGNLQQNLWLLNKIQSNNYYKSGLPGTQQQGGSSGKNPLEDNADELLNNITPQQSFQDVMPQETWNSIFDEWTRNFANEYMLPEWQKNTYDPSMKGYVQDLGNLNQKIGLAGRRSVAAEKTLSDAAEETMRQEENLRTQYQSGLADLRQNVITNWATPLYKSQMDKYMNSPWADLNLGEMSTGAGLDVGGIIDELNQSYNGQLPDLETLMGNLGDWSPTSGSVPLQDWTVPKGNLDLLSQYKLT